MKMLGGVQKLHRVEDSEMRATLLVPQNKCFHFLWFSALSRGSSERKCGFRGLEEPGDLFWRIRGFPFLGVSHLFVTSIWIMKLERKTRRCRLHSI